MNSDYISGEKLRNLAWDLGVELSLAQMEQFDRYRAGLQKWNEASGVTSSNALKNVDRVHFLDSLSLVPILRHVIPSALHLVDVGPGGGFPSVPVKIVLSNLRVTLVESTSKKATFLRWLVEELELSNMEILPYRAETVGQSSKYRERFDVATARALGGLATVLELTLPFCRIGGFVLAPRGRDASNDVVDSIHAQARLGGRIKAIERGFVGQSSVIVVEKMLKTPSKYPRRSGMPDKKPLALGMDYVGKLG